MFTLSFFINRQDMGWEEKKKHMYLSPGLNADAKFTN